MGYTLRNVVEDKEREFNNLKEKLKSLGIRIASKEEFEKKFQYYKENWERLVKE